MFSGPFIGSCYIIFIVAIYIYVHILYYSPQGCIKRFVSQPYGETYPDVWGLSGPYANSSVPHEQRHHGVGLQRDVPGKTNGSQLCRETRVKVSASLVMESISHCIPVNDISLK